MNAPLSAETVSKRMRPGRRIDGQSAVLLPFTRDGEPDLKNFQKLLSRTAAAGITPAVNMDTGYVNLLTADQRQRVLDAAAEAGQGKRLTCSVFVEATVGDPLAAYRAAMKPIAKIGGLPILFQCPALHAMSDDAVFHFYRAIGEQCDAFLGFELGQIFAPFGKVYSLELYQKLLSIPQLKGAKHSSLNRVLEWQRLDLRDRERPEFHVYTGNDLAIDMVAYGSDYLLGLSAFWPEAFAQRDRWWLENDARFWGLNDLLQYLGFFAFRPPVPAYKHSAAQFLKIRGLIDCDEPHPRAARRPAEDVAVLRDIAQRIEVEMNA